MLAAGVFAALVAPVVAYAAFKMPGPSDHARTVALVGAAILLEETAVGSICVALDSLQVAPAYAGVFETAVYTLAGLEVVTLVTLVFAYFREVQRHPR